MTDTKIVRLPTATAAAPMTKAERADLARTVRQRAKLLKLKAAERKAALLAEFERQMASTYRFDQNEVWEAAHAAAERAAREAKAIIDRECKRLGIMREFRPTLDVSWYHRGENATKERRAELRRVAITRLEAMEEEACVAIETESLHLQTELVVNGLTTEAGRAFLQGLGPIEAAMPALDFRQVQALLTARRQRYD